jgi:hypothetical protein
MLQIEYSLMIYPVSVVFYRVFYFIVALVVMYLPPSYIYYTVFTLFFFLYFFLIVLFSTPYFLCCNRRFVSLKYAVFSWLYSVPSCLREVYVKKVLLFTVNITRNGMQNPIIKIASASF